MYYNPQKLIDWGYSQVGYPEKDDAQHLDSMGCAGNRNYTKYAALLDSLGDFYNGIKQGQMWCDVFYDAGMVECYGRKAAQYLLCQPDRSCGAGCRFSAEYYKVAGRFFKSGPQKGDQIFFGSSWDNVTHTGMVVDVRDGRVYTIEGNSSNRVAERNYAVDAANIFGYGRPDWGVPPAQAEGDAGKGEPSEERPSVPAPVPDTCTVRLPVLRKGDMSEAVRALQYLLEKRGFRCGWMGCDGEFGPRTQSALGKFQMDRALEHDGIAGAQVWAALICDQHG